MKNVVLSVFFLGTVAAAATVDEARHCYDSATSMSAVQACFAQAAPFADSTHFEERALYFRALIYHVEPHETPQSYQLVADQIAGYYRQQIESDLKSLSAYSEPTLRDTLAGIGGLTFYGSLFSNEELGLDRERDIFAELIFRNAATKEDALARYGDLLLNSEWDLASDLTAQWPSLTPLPKRAGVPSGLGYYTLSPDGKALLPATAALDSGPKIVMYGDCHFAVDAIHELAKHPEIVAAMQAYGLALAGARFTDFAELETLRRQYPAFEWHPLHKTADWNRRGIDVLASPTWLFLLDGQPQYEFRGSTDELVDQFHAGMKRIGLTQ